MSESKIEGFVITPFKDGDKVLVNGENTEGWEREIFDKDVDCEECQSMNRSGDRPYGAFLLENEPQVGLCWSHLVVAYKKIRIEEQIRDFVYVWERAANSGIVEFEKTTIKHVRVAAWSADHVKSTIIVGNIVEQYGERK